MAARTWRLVGAPARRQVDPRVGRRTGTIAPQAVGAWRRWRSAPVRRGVL